MMPNMFPGNSTAAATQSGGFSNERSMEYFETSTPPPEMSNKLPSQLSWSQVHSDKLLQIYTKRKADFCYPRQKKQKVWKEIADEVQQKCLLPCNGSQCREQIERLKDQYENYKNKHRRETTWRMDCFLAEAEKAFETTVHPGDVKKQTSKRKKVDPPISTFSTTAAVPGSSVANSTATTTQSDEKKFRDFKTINSPAGVSSGLPVQNCERDAEEYRSWYPPDPVENWDTTDDTEMQTIEKEKVDIPFSNLSITTDVPGSSADNSIIPPRNASKRRWRNARKTILLKVYAQYKAELSSPGVKEETVWKKIAEKVRKRTSLDCDEIECRKKIEGMKCAYEKKKNGQIKVKRRKFARYYDKVGKIFEPTENSVISPVGVSSGLPVQNCEYDAGEYQSWYPPDPVENWDTIDDTEKQTIEEGKVDIPISTLSITTAVPGSSADNSIIPPPDASTKRWTDARDNILLKVYAQYKAELSSPGVKEETVWKKIAEEVRESTSLDCDEIECSKEIERMKCAYEKNKNGHFQEICRNKNGHIKAINRRLAIYFDELGKFFEPDEFSAKQSNIKYLKGCNKKNRKYHLALINLYSKYKREFNSPGVDELKVWRKIAREIREHYSFNCGESLCRLDLLRMKERYESFKKNQKTGRTPFFLDEARKVFDESDVKLGSQDEK